MAADGCWIYVDQVLNGLNPARLQLPADLAPTAFPSVARLIRRVIELTGPLRDQASGHLQQRVWLYPTVRAIQGPAKFGL